MAVKKLAFMLMPGLIAAGICAVLYIQINHEGDTNRVRDLHNKGNQRVAVKGRVGQIVETVPLAGHRQAFTLRDDFGDAIVVVTNQAFPVFGSTVVASGFLQPADSNPSTLVLRETGRKRLHDPQISTVLLITPPLLLALGLFAGFVGGSRRAEPADSRRAEPADSPPVLVGPTDKEEGEAANVPPVEAPKQFVGVQIEDRAFSRGLAIGESIQVGQQATGRKVIQLPNGVPPLLLQFKRTAYDRVYVTNLYGASGPEVRYKAGDAKGILSMTGVEMKAGDTLVAMDLQDVVVMTVLILAADPSATKPRVPSNN